MANSTIVPIHVAYRGSVAKGEAERVHQVLDTAGVDVEPLSEVKEPDVKLGAAEIIITIVVTAAVKAAVKTSLEYLEKYLRSRVENESPDANIQLVVKSPHANRPRRFPINLRQLTSEAVGNFFAEVRAVVSELL